MNREIEDRLNRHISYKGIPITVISQRTGISSGILYSCFRGTRRLRADELISVCAFLEINPTDLISKLQPA